MALATDRTRSSETLSLDRSDRSFLSRSSLSSPPDREVQAQHPCARLLVAMITVLEMSTFIPTLWLELRLGRAIEQFVLRLSLMLLRLYPIWRVLTMCLYHRGLARCVVMLPFSIQWRCRQWLRSGSCSKLPEIRWGLAVTLDLWFLLTTHLVEGLGGVMATACIAFLLVNSLLCTFDILTLVMLLLYGKNVAEIYPEVTEVTFHRSKSIKWGPEGGTDSTCVICLSEFVEGESVQLLPCGHFFHRACIAHWLRVGHHCPMRCPEFVLPPESRDAETGESAESMGESAESIAVRASSGGPDELMVLPGEVPS